MKLTKMMIISALIVIGVGFICGNTYAANADYICTVDQVGAWRSSDTRIMLTDAEGAFTQKWFLAKDEREKEMMSLAMTAIVADLSVLIRVNLDSESTPEISRFLIIAP